MQGSSATSSQDLDRQPSPSSTLMKATTNNAFGYQCTATPSTQGRCTPFDPLTLTPGLDTKKFSEILRRYLTKLANNTRHNIPLEVALQAVGAEYGVPMNMNQILDKHQKVTVPLTMVTLIGGGVILAVIGVTIWRGIKERRETAVMLRYVTQRQDMLYNREEPNNQSNQLQPRATPPERDMIFPDPPPYNG
jgi:hypothetical protein